MALIFKRPRIVNLSSKKNHCVSVGGYTNSVDIANAFADNFTTVCHQDTPA